MNGACKKITKSLKVFHNQQFTGNILQGKDETEQKAVQKRHH